MTISTVVRVGPDILHRMPMYEYRCRACGHTFDRLRPLAEADASAPCDCGSADTTRLVSKVARRVPAGAELPMAGGGGGAAAGGGCCGGGCCS